MLLVVYLEYLYDNFLIHRILAKSAQTDSKELYDSAWELLCAALVLSRERDRLLKIQNELSWPVCIFSCCSTQLTLLI